MGSPKKSYDAYYFRLVESNVNHINEHLEAMQRDAHGLEFGPWKLEVDYIWKRTFELFNSMNEDVQKRALELLITISFLALEINHLRVYVHRIKSVEVYLI